MIFNCIKTSAVRKTLGIGLILGVWVLLGGWKWWGDENRDIKFTHQRHVQEEELACEDCHADTTENVTGQFPKEEFCADCHEETEVVAGSKKGCLLCHNTEAEKLPLRGEGDFKVTLGPEPYKDLLFSHKEHAGEQMECATCHEDIEEDDNLLLPRDDYLPTAQQCLNCHVEENVSNDCNTCHSEIKSEIAPNDHEKGWSRFHGIAANLTMEGVHEEDCLTCHLETECASCHASETPQNHTAFWKLRGHGMVITADRESCDTCHTQQEFCASCHNETAPANHVGNWEVRHCTSCHLDSNFSPENNSCAVCHRTAVHYLK